VVLAPRFAGEELRPEPGASVFVSIFATDHGDSSPLIGVGTLYATHDEASVAQAEIDRYMFGEG